MHLFAVPYRNPTYFVLISDRVAEPRSTYFLCIVSKPLLILNEIFSNAKDSQEK